MSLSFLLATWFGLGKLPKAPGTWGSLGALPFAWVLQSLGGPLALGIGFLVICAIAWWSITDFLHRWPGEDPQEIVIDEVAGQWLVLLFVPPDLLLYAIGFVLFRVLDITKPWPASWADGTLSGTAGVFLDDVLAAIYGAIAMALLVHYWW
ncbi:phosphatidylglycerophosphatase A family protein [Ferrovibrio sp.]|uniref:phosphatidylglycerophosphatase A family protein n=1 Tax=Ferrovibrio sp. TaxID=1917215 RepID=UPI003D11A109